MSNAAPSYSATWWRLGFGEIFEEMINSSEVGAAKPDPRIVHLTSPREAEAFLAQVRRRTDP